MPKKPAQKKPAKKKTNNSHWLAQHKFLTIVGVIVLLGVAAWVSASVYHQVQVNRERAKFMAVKTDLHELAQDISSTIGKPTTSKEVQSCNYASAEFGLGALSCEVSIYLAYSINGSSQAEKNIRQIDSIISTKAGPIAELSLDNINNISAYSFNRHGLRCFVDNWRVDEQSTIPISDFRNVGVNVSKGIETLISCSGNALQPYFPVTDGSDYLP